MEWKTWLYKSLENGKISSNLFLIFTGYRLGRLPTICGLTSVSLLLCKCSKSIFVLYHIVLSIYSFNEPEEQFPALVRQVIFFYGLPFCSVLCGSGLLLAL